MNWQIRVYNPTKPNEAVTALWSALAPVRYSLGNDAACDLQIPAGMSELGKDTWSELVLGPDRAPRLVFVSDAAYKPREQSLFEGINFLLEEQLVLELKQLE